MMPNVAGTPVSFAVFRCRDGRVVARRNRQRTILGARTDHPPGLTTRIHLDNGPSIHDNQSNLNLRSAAKALAHDGEMGNDAGQ